MAMMAILRPPIPSSAAPRASRRSSPTIRPSDIRPITGPSERFPALDFPATQAAAISPILFADGKDPATLIVHGDADELVNISSGKAIYDALRIAGAKTEFVVIKGGDHGFSNADHRAEAGRAMAKWFKENL